MFYWRLTRRDGTRTIAGTRACSRVRPARGVGVTTAVGAAHPYNVGWIDQTNEHRDTTKNTPSARRADRLRRKAGPGGKATLKNHAPNIACTRPAQVDGGAPAGEA